MESEAVGREVVVGVGTFLFAVVLKHIHPIRESHARYRVINVVRSMYVYGFNVCMYAWYV